MTDRNLRCKTFYIADYEHANILGFRVLDKKLLLEEDSDSDTDHLYIHSDSFYLRLTIDVKCCHLLALTLYQTKQT